MQAINDKSTDQDICYKKQISQIKAVIEDINKKLNPVLKIDSTIDVENLSLDTELLNDLNNIKGQLKNLLKNIVL